MLFRYNKSGPEENTRFHNNQMYLDRYWSDLNFKAVEALSEIAGSHNLTLLQLAMKWCISNSTVTSIVSGVRTLEQIKQNMAVLDDHVLDSSVLKACDEVWESLTGSRFSYCR